MTLVILAAGMGSRFGGLKQIEKIDEEGNFIIDYSVYDAVRAGFNKIVFIINEENYEIFKSTIGSRISKKVQVKYVFQNNNNLKKFINIPESRKKPFGTAHALYCAKEYIDGNFGIISADDFYGYRSFKKLYESLKNNTLSAIGFKLKNTMSENGSVKRGICFSENGYVIENNDYVVEKVNDKIIGKEIIGNRVIELDENQEVAMLMYGLNKDIIEYMDKDIKEFLNKNIDKIDSIEYLLPNVLTDMINKDKLKMKVIKTDEKWMGITYKEDLQTLKDYIIELKKSGVYPNKLY